MPVPPEAAARIRAPRYVERLPGPELEPWIECYWSIQAADVPSMASRILPDGCADLIVGISGHPRPMVVGAMRTAAVFPLVGRIDLFGVRFRPGGAFPFFEVPLGEFTDRRIPLEQIWPAGAEAFAAHAPADRVDGAERVLRRRLRTRTRRRDEDEALAARAVGLLRQARGGIGVREVAVALGVGERRLERVFDRSVGLGPKALGRVMRFRHAAREIRLGRAGRTPRSWAALAFSAGYADQSHLIREFRALAGVTPADYAAEHRDVGFIQDGAGAPE
jgi:AraC-like DNA-binding protein